MSRSPRFGWSSVFLSGLTFLAWLGLGGLALPSTLVDPGFDPGSGADDDIFSLALQPAGRIVIGGQFLAFNHTQRSHVARLEANGAVDLTFNPGTGANGDVYAVAVQRGGKVLLGGEFTQVNGQARPYAARLNADGSLDSSFATNATLNGALRALAVLPDGMILIAGRFTEVAGQSRGRIARLTADGALDPEFNPGTGANDHVRTLTLQSDSKILIGGAFTEFDAASRPGVARLNADGSLDTTFDPGLGADDEVRAIAVETNGLIYVGGDFETYNGTNRSAVARLFPDGGLDLSFDPGDAENDTVRAIALQEAKAWIGGWFLTAGGLSRRHLARLNADGTGDPTVRVGSGPDDEVFAIVRQPDGRLLIGGKFDEVDGIERAHIARLYGEETTNTITFASAQFVAKESAGEALITVRRIGAADGSVSVTCLTSNGTADAGSDYVATNVTLTFGPGESVKEVRVQLLADSVFEGVETVNVIITRPVGAALGPQATAVLEIIEYDSLISVPAVAYANESDPAVVIRLTRSGDCALAATVDWNMTGGTATAGADVSGTGGTVRFEAGETSQSISVVLVNDGLVEAHETIEFTLSHPTGQAVLGTSGSSATVLATIWDNDHPMRFDRDFSFAFHEHLGPAVLTVVRGDDGPGPVTVNYHTLDATAVAGHDYVATNGTLFFSSSTNRTATISVPLINNSDRDTNSRVFSVVLSEPTGGAVLGQSSAEVYIVDNEQGISFWTGYATVSEGDGVVPFLVYRGDDRLTTATVDYHTTNGTALAGSDYVGQSGTLVFEPGVEWLSFDVPLINDREPEESKNFSVVLSNATGGSFLGSASEVSVVINDNDTMLEFAQAEFSVVEADGTAMITVTRTGAPGPVSVQYFTGNLTATAGADYTAVSGTVQVLGLTPAVTFAVPILNDDLAEDPEQVLLQLRNPTGGGFLGPQSNAVLTIYESGIGFLATNIAVNEASGVIAVALVRRGNLARTASVDYALFGQSAEAGADFAAGGGTVFFAPGEATNTIGIPILDDGLVEDDETFVVTLSDPTGGAGVGTNQPLAVLVQDNEVAALVDLSFDPGLGPTNTMYSDATVYALVVQPVGKVLVGGAFQSFAGKERHGLARLNPDGSLDESFVPATAVTTPTWYHSVVRALALQTDGRVVIGGSFRLMGSNTNCLVARLNPDGSVDDSFQSTVASSYSDRVSALVLQPDGRLLVGGNFGDWQPGPYFVRLLANGLADDSFAPTAPVFPVLALALQPDQKVIAVGGFFIPDGGPSHGNVMRYESTGIVDLSFESYDPTLPWGGSEDVGADSYIYAVAVRPSGAIVLGGAFSTFNEQPRPGLAQLDANGRLDPMFTPALDGWPWERIAYSLALQPDGKLLAGVDSVLVEGVRRNGLVRFNADGSLDHGFNPGAGFGPLYSRTVNAIALQPDGKILVGGEFNNINGTIRRNVARLHADSTELNGFEFLPQTVSVPEQSGEAHLTVRRTGDSSTSRAVNGTIQASTGGATPDVDFVAQTADLTFAPLDVVKTISTSILDDALVEADESFEVAFSAVPGEPVLSFGGPAAVTILDDDPLRLQARIAEGDVPRLILEGHPGRVVALERSTDLRFWTTIATNPPSAASWEFIDTHPVAGPARFYRLRVSPR